jgi:hypothetical protein
MMTCLPSVRHADTPPIPRASFPRTTICLVAWLAGAGILLAQAVSRDQMASPAGKQPTESVPPTADQDQPKNRLREGTELADLAGSFHVTGDRVTFSAANNVGRFVCLENLNLERIVRAVTDNPDQSLWNVSGKVTEYQGANYLLIERASFKSDSRD